MKKVILMILFISSLLLGKDVFEKEIDKNFTKEELKDMNIKINSDDFKEKISFLKKSFEESTGDKNFDKYLSIAKKDINWKKANYSFMYKNRDGKFGYNGEVDNIKTPEYEKALDYFALSVKENKDNILAAYQGFFILEKYFLYFGGNKITSKYLKIFSEPLYKKNYCLGYLYYAKSMTKKYGGKSEYPKILNILEEGKNKCNKKDISDFYVMGLKHEYALNKTLFNVNIKKEKANNSNTIDKTKGNNK